MAEHSMRRPQGALRWPPAVSANSSSSSLSGMERAIPFFKTFVKRTPPLDAQEPLPPIPYVPRRASTAPASSPRLGSSYTCRSSSIYSRRTSAYPDDTVSINSADFADSSLYLQPIAYSASTPQIAERLPTPPLLQPRAYEPLLRSPSPSTIASRKSSESPLPEPRPSMLLPPPPTPIHIPKNHFRTVSLEKAQANLHAPGAQHLLPEELRALSLGKSRSHEPLRVVSEDFFSLSPASSPGLQVPAQSTLLDTQGRDRMISSPRASLASPPLLPLPPISAAQLQRKLSDNSFRGVGNGVPRQMLDLSNQPRKFSKAKIVQALGLSDPDDVQQRGRPRIRSPVATGPRTLHYAHYLPQKKPNMDGDEDVETDAQQLAREYHALLTEEYRRPSETVLVDDVVEADMKLVPQPLFFPRPVTRLNDHYGRRRGSGSSVSPFAVNSYAGRRLSGSTDSIGSQRLSNPIKLSLTPSPKRHDRRSTSGSIPISPPSASVSRTPLEPPMATIIPGRQSPRIRRNSDNGRVSAFYPHVMHRSKKGKDGTYSPATPPLRLLSTGIIAERVKTPSQSPMHSSPQRIRLSSGSRESAESDRSTDSTPFLKRFRTGVAKLADELTRPTNHEPTINAIATPGSPHLLPSPVRSKQPPQKLRLTDIVHSTYDKARSSLHSEGGATVSPHASVVYTPGPAKPLDNSKTGRRESDNGVSGGSIFASVLDYRRESKAAKRREALKKMIKLVP